jgi:hypothetical protein
VVVIGSAGLLVGSLSLLAVGTVTPVALLVVAAKRRSAAMLSPASEAAPSRLRLGNPLVFRRPGGPLAALSWGSVSADGAAHREL